MDLCVKIIKIWLKSCSQFHNFDLKLASVYENVIGYILFISMYVNTFALVSSKQADVEKEIRLI